MVLVCDECLLLCKDVLEFGYVKEFSSEQYVFDVFYKDVDKFGNEIIQLVWFLFVEYFIIDIIIIFFKDLVYIFFIL